jgi:type II secretory pathway predicted ATPase ExeA
MSRYRHIGLIREPFSPEPDLAFLAPTLGLADARARLGDFVAARGSIALISGTRGIGKSMLRLALQNDLAPRAALRIVPLDRPAEWSTDVAFLRTVSLAFGGEATGRTTLDLLTEIEARLAVFADDDHWPVLLIDDAHRLTSSQLELLRTISSLEPNSLSVILFAEPDLEERIARRRSLDSRVELRHRLNPLNSGDAHALLRHRLRLAAPSGDDTSSPFDDAAIRELVAQANGIPGSLMAFAAKAIDLAARRNAAGIDEALVVEATGGKPVHDPALRQIAFDLGEADAGNRS